MQAYTTVLKSAAFEYEEKKSIFIGEACPVQTEAEALEFIELAKKRYPDAKHHVYAYVLRENSTMRFSDDREPQGTAGMPTLDAIRKNGCTDTVIVVTRYFGGTLLGTGGLVRAYTAAALGALKNAEIITYDIYSEYTVMVGYSDHGKIVSALTELGFRTDETLYLDEVTLKGTVRSANEDAFVQKITEATSARAKITKNGEKFNF